MQRTILNTAVCLALGLSGAAFAQGPSQEHRHLETDDRSDLQLTGIHAPHVKRQTRAQAQQHDLELVAKAKGWTVAEAAADRRAAEAVGAVAAKLAAERPDLFVGSELSAVPGGTPLLYVKGAAEREVYDLVAAADTHIEVVDNQPFSYDELEKRKLEVHTALADIGYQDIMTSFDFREAGKINAKVSRIAGLPKSTRQIEQRLPEALRNEVRISVIDEPVGVDFYAYGGMAVKDDGVFECTSGWSVQNFWGTRGVTTAGHCNGINQINHPGIGDHSMSHQAEHRGSWGDIEWKTTVATESADFYASASSVRDVNSVESWAALSIGESICFYGRSSNSRDCSFDVEATSVSCTVSGVFNNRLVRMNGNSAIGGDSGGGWSWGTRAYGSVKGICGGKAVFSLADYYDEALGVFVRTQ